MLVLPVSVWADITIAAALGVDRRAVEQDEPARHEQEPQEWLDHVRVQDVVRPGQEPVRVELDPVALIDPDVERRRQGAKVLAVADDPVESLDGLSVEMRPATDEPASDDDIGFHPVGDVERRELGQMDGRGDPDDAVNVVLVGAVDRDLVAPVPAGPDPVVRDEVADPERQPERDEVRMR